MLAPALWWLGLSALGWLTWPLAASVFERSPGKGYAYARVFGLLLLSYLYWAVGTVGWLPNTRTSLWTIAGILSLVCIVSWLRRRAELLEYLRSEWRHVLTIELLSLIVFALYAFYKAHDPAIDHTEEPMDFAFLNGILRSPRMPPNDPWLSGHPISYYYLGYLTVAAPIRLTGLPSGVGYNLGLAHTLALTIVAGYGLLYDLLNVRRDRGLLAGPGSLFALMGGVAIGLAGNLEGILELPRALGFGGQRFYRWLAVPGLSEAQPTGTWLPQGNWWWRASRIITDANILGRTPTVITEFPAFSFILGDLHPHVMALPYLLMALGVASVLYQGAREGLASSFWLQPRYWAMAWALGALGFLNSWDLPTILMVAALALLLGRCQGSVHPERRGRDCLLSLLWLVLASVLPYLPFYLQLSSQAQGLGIVHYAKTPLKHYLLCFGPWLLPILATSTARFWRLWERHGERIRPWRLVGAWVGVSALPWLGTMVLGGWTRAFLGLVSLATAGPWLLLLQSALLTILGVDLFFSLRDREDSESLFARSLILVGVGLTYATEFFYLRDVFNTRMNTVFKVYYQAWILMGVGAIWSIAYLWGSRGKARIVSYCSGLILVACLYYPIAAAYARAADYRGAATLDGTALLRLESPADYGAYDWLQEHAPPGAVLVEAPGEDYVASTNRLSAWTGIPTVLGWPGHEVQWRGDDREVRKRRADLQRIYSPADENQVLAVLREYGATYLYVGVFERGKYDLDEEDLAWYGSFLHLRYVEGDVRLYEIPRGDSQGR